MNCTNTLNSYEVFNQDKGTKVSTRKLKALKEVILDLGYQEDVSTSMSAMVLNNVFTHILIISNIDIGKSTLSGHVLYNLVHRYNDNQLETILLDCSTDTDTNGYEILNILPQSSLIVRTTDENYILSLLENLSKEINRRLDLFRIHLVEGIDGYNTLIQEDSILPRTLVYVQELEKVLKHTSDDTILKIRTNLDNILEYGKYCGFHLILHTKCITDVLSRHTVDKFSIKCTFK